MSSNDYGSPRWRRRRCVSMASRMDMRIYASMATVIGPTACKRNSNNPWCNYVLPEVEIDITEQMSFAVLQRRARMSSLGRKHKEREKETDRKLTRNRGDTTIDHVLRETMCTADHRLQLLKRINIPDRVWICCCSNSARRAASNTTRSKSVGRTGSSGSFFSSFSRVSLRNRLIPSTRNAY